MKKSEQKKRKTESQKNRKIAVLVTMLVVLVGIGLNPMLVIFGEMNASSESEKVAATNLDSEDSAEEQDEVVKKTETETEATVESEVTEEKRTTDEKGTTQEKEANQEKEAKENPGSDEVESKKIIMGKWGDSQYVFSTFTGVLTIGPGVLGGSNESPWNRSTYDSSKVEATKIKNIVLEALKGEVFAPQDSSRLFSSDTELNLLNNLESITNLDKLDTSKVQNMESMFYFCSKLDSLDLSMFNTENVKYMDDMFKDIKLNKLILGDKFRFVIGTTNSPGLQAPKTMAEGDLLTGDWTREKVKSKGYSPAQFMANYGTKGLEAGTYVAEKALMFWGTSPCIIDEGVLTIKAGKLAGYKESPWNRNTGLKIEASTIKNIVLEGEVVAPEDSSKLFSADNKDSFLTNMTTITNLQNLNTSNVKSMVKMFYLCNSLNSLYLSKFDTSSVQSMDSMFNLCVAIESLDLSSFDTSRVNNMNFMFYSCTSLKSLDLSSFNMSRVTTSNSMFTMSRINKLILGTKFKFSKKNTNNSDLQAPGAMVEGDYLTGNWIRENGKAKGYSPVEFMANYGSDDLNEGTYVAEKDFNLWGTSPFRFDKSTGVLTIKAGKLAGYKESPWNRTDDFKVEPSAITNIVLEGEVVAPENSSYLFSANLTDNLLTNMTTITNLNKLETSKVKNMENMFYKCELLGSLDLSSFDMSNVFYFQSMFRSTEIKKLILGTGFKFSTKFGYNSNLQAPRAMVEGDILTGNWIRSDGESKAYSPEDFMNKYGTDDLKEGTYIAEVFCWGTSPLNFDKSKGVLKIKAGNLAGYEESPWNRTDRFKVEASTIDKIVLEGNVVAPVDSSYLFSSVVGTSDNFLKNMWDITNIEKLDTSKVTDMTSMFGKCSSLENLDLSTFDTSKVTDMKSMFRECSSLENLDLSTFDTGIVTDMNYMFYNCFKLDILNVSTFNMSSVVNFNNMFRNCFMKQLVLGDNFKFSLSANNFSSLPIPSAINEGDSLTFKWKLAGLDNATSYTPLQFMDSYNNNFLGSGTYIGEIKNLITFKYIPVNLSFKDSTLSNKELEIHRKQDDWKLVVDDRRVANKGQWSVTAKLVEPFQTFRNDLLENILYYREDGKDDQLIGTEASVMVFEGGNSEDRTTNVMWSKGQGPFLKVPPGTAKRDRYKCKIVWELILGP